MQQQQKNMIAGLVKEGRMAKGYTQKELSELSNISIRSIQRIENGDLMPRSHTLKTIAGVLGLPFAEFLKNAPEQTALTDDAQDTEAAPVRRPVVNKAQRVILSLGACMAVLLLAWAYTAQSPRFPETDFERLVFSALIILAITGLLLAIWRTKR